MSCLWQCDVQRQIMQGVRQGEMRRGRKKEKEREHSELWLTTKCVEQLTKYSAARKYSELSAVVGLALLCCILLRALENWCICQMKCLHICRQFIYIFNYLMSTKASYLKNS